MRRFHAGARTTGRVPHVSTYLTVVLSCFLTKSEYELSYAHHAAAAIFRASTQFFRALHYSLALLIVVFELEIINDFFFARAFESLLSCDYFNIVSEINKC